jgi:phage terminase small subunit
MKQTRTRTTSKKPALDPKQVAFCEAYLRTFNKSEAYRISHPGCQVQTSWTNGERALRNEKVQAYIAKRLKQMVMSADEVLARLSDHARGSLEHFLDINDEGFAGINLAGDDAKSNLHLLKKIKTVRTRRTVGRGPDAEPWEDERVEIEIHDPQRALEQLGKYHNLFAEKDEDGNPITDEERIARVMAILDDARARRDGQTPAGN